MTSEEINPFASPETVTAREATKHATMLPTDPVEQQDWPYEATELAEIEELARPWGKPMSVVRKWGAGRWLGIFLVGLAVSYFVVALTAPVISMMNSAQATATAWVFAGVVVLVFTLVGRYAREDACDYRGLKKLIGKRKGKIEPPPQGQEPIFVVLVPRTRWAFPGGPVTAYVAFAYLDADEKRLFLDADQFRFRIPVSALLDVSVERMSKGLGMLSFVRLVMQTQTGPQELCFRLGNTKSFWQTDGQRKALAEEYRDRISRLKNSA